jgi:enterochelin esterase-like enzyme
MIARLLAAGCLLAAVAAHADVPRASLGHVERLADFRSRHVPARHVDVWLPPTYDGRRAHDVLYMHDGQMLFDARATWNGQEWRVDEVAGALIAAGRVRPFIVVGVWNAGPRRHVEYFPQRPFEALSPKQQTAQYALKIDATRPLFDGRVDSDAYLRFLVEELAPWIETRYRVRRGPAHTAIAGSSMGGLVSLYALAEYPDVFGAAACLSTHWPGSFKARSNPLPDAFFAYLARRLPPAGRHRLYFDHGTDALDATYADLQRRVDALVAAHGYGARDWKTAVFPGATHSEDAWAARLDVPLTFLFGAAR